MVARTEKETRAFAAGLVDRFQAGDTVLLRGELGAGKTTFVRGFVEALGHEDPVRSPTFNLIQLFETDPPVMHADLYRIDDPSRLGLEEYEQSHICFIEWPERLAGTFDQSRRWRIQFSFVPEGRKIDVEAPDRA